MLTRALSLPATVRPLSGIVLAIGLVGCATQPGTRGVETMDEFVVIAHRGASGYLPEHTLEATAVAHAMEADYIEQDVVLTRDDVLILLHDLYLDDVTDVADRFGGRQRQDGRFYAIDFTLEEIRTLRVHERSDRSGRAERPGRFPVETAIFRIPTLAEAIALIQGLNRSTGREVGLYVEPKAPAWHAGEGKDLMAAVLAELGAHGLRDPRDNILLQSFDQAALRRARQELGSKLRMVQLIGDNSWNESPTDFDRLRSPEGLAEIAAYAQGIGPWLPQVVNLRADSSVTATGLVAAAHGHGLFVHAYTLRADELPPAAGSLDQALDRLVREIHLDGVFTDHPDRVRSYLANPPELSRPEH